MNSYDTGASRDVPAQSRRLVRLRQLPRDVAHHSRHTSLGDQVAGAVEKTWEHAHVELDTNRARLPPCRRAEHDLRVAGRLLQIDEAMVRIERGADERPDNPIGSRVRRHHREQRADDDRNERGPHRTAWMKARANGETSTSPEANGNRPLNPSLFASRINVTPRSCSLSISDENVGHSP